MTTPASLSCPKCGAALAADSPEGLCPRCLAAASLVGETELTGDEAAPAPPVSIEAIAPHFPQLEILVCLGRGGMGIVYKARQKTLNRFVALKLLAPERVQDAAFAERFAREAQALAALSHPGIVTIYDFGEAGRFFYLLMEFVDGVNLRQAMRAGHFTPEEALAIVPPVCDALHYAHEHGIVHRDIKPENLLLDKEGRVKIADFGIAKMLNAEGITIGLVEAQAVGTPQYMAPEQRDHRRTDHRADIYSLGVVLYELLTGELPADRLQPPSRKVHLDVRLDEIVLRALEESPARRYQTAVEMRTDVETVAGTPAPRAGFGHPPLAFVAFFCVAASALLGVAAWGSSLDPSHRVLLPVFSAAVLALLLALPVRGSRLRRSALVFSALNLALWLFVAGGAELLLEYELAHPPEPRITHHIADSTLPEFGTAYDSNDVPRFQLQQKLLDAIAQHLTAENSPLEPGESISFRRLTVDVEPGLKAAQIYVYEPKAAPYALHKGKWFGVNEARFYGTTDDGENWRMASGPLNLEFKVFVPDEPGGRLKAGPPPNQAREPVFGPAHGTAR